MRTRHPTIPEKLVTFVVAVIPATLLQMYTIVGLFFGIAAIFQGDFEGLILALWCAGGVFGALALWGIMFSMRSSWVAFGLIAGFLAILPLVGIVGAATGAPLSLVWTIGLPLSAVYWLFRIDWLEPEDEMLLLEYHSDDGHSDLP